MDYVGHDRSCVAYSSGTLSDATRLSSLTGLTTPFLILLEAPALFLALSFRECHTPEAGCPGTSLLGTSVNRGNLHPPWGGASIREHHLASKNRVYIQCSNRHLLTKK